MSDLHELFQAEWCPHSHAVRQRMTELGIDFICRQVEPSRDDRARLHERTGQRSIPALVTVDDRVIAGEEGILTFLNEVGDESGGGHALAHQAKAIIEQAM